MQNSELQSSNAKFRLFQQQYIQHSRAATTLINTFQSIKSIQLQRSSSFQKLLSPLDSLQSAFYKGLATKLATYLDTVVFQIEHMIEDFNQNISEYMKLKTMIETRFTHLMRQFKRKRSDTADALKVICQTVIKNVTQPSRQNIGRYNQCLTQYSSSNDELIVFRKQYQARMMTEANNQIMNFFVLELEKLRNNQFDIDQILKKQDSSQSQFKLMKINEDIMWQFIEIGPLDQRISTLYGMNQLNQIVNILWKEKAPPTNQIFSLFVEKQYDSNLKKLPVLLQSPAYRQFLIPTFLTFHHQKLLIKDDVFKNIYQILKIILQYSLTIMQWDLLQTSLAFASSICTQRIISYDKDLQLCQIVCLLDYVKMLDCFKEEKMVELLEAASKTDQKVREKEIQRCRKVAKRLGFFSLDNKGKKRIFERNNLKNEKIEQ